MQEECVRNGRITNEFLIKVGLLPIKPPHFLANLGLFHQTR